MSLVFQEAPRTTMQGNYFSNGSEREFHGIATESCSKEFVYEQFRTFVWDGRLFDFHGVPLAKDDGLSVETDDPSGKYWLCRVRYAVPSETTIAEDAAETACGVEYGAFPSGFSTTGGSSRLIRSFGTTRYNIAAVAPDFGGLIGWNGEGFDGVEVVAPKLTFSIQKRSPADAVANFAEFITPLADLVGKTNDAKFYGFSPGACLFLGVSSGSLQRSQGTSTDSQYLYWDVKCEFAASPDVSFQQGQTTINKPGWDAYWQLVEKSYDPTTGLIVPVVVGSYVERCYQRADFSWFTN